MSITNAKELTKHDSSYARVVRFNFDRDDHEEPVTEKELELVHQVIDYCFLFSYSKVESGELYHIEDDVYEFHYDIYVEEE